jgi:hypothetical protein
MLSSDVTDSEVDSETSPRRKVTIPDAHLQSPIRPDNRRFLNGSRLPYPSFLKECIEQCPIPSRDMIIDSEFSYGYLFMKSLTSRRVDEWVITHYAECADVISEQIKLIMSEMNLPNPASTMMYGPEEFTLLTSKRAWDNIKSKMRERKVTQKGWSNITPSHLPGVTRQVYSPNYLLIDIDKSDTRWYVLDYDQVMMINDTVSSRVMSIIYNRMLPPDTPGKLSEEILLYVYEELDQKLVLNGNNAYDEIALWEPCCVAVMYSQHDRLKASKNYVKWFENEIESGNLTGLQKVYRQICDQKLDMPQLSEMHGIYRHWGHPTVNESLGSEKVQSIGTTRTLPVDNTVLLITGALKRQFVASFISKKGCWPKIVTPDELKGKPISKLVREQRKVINFYSPKYPLEDWGELRFGQEFDFDYHEDFTSLLEDRSIS